MKGNVRVSNDLVAANEGNPVALAAFLLFEWHNFVRGSPLSCRDYAAALGISKDRANRLLRLWRTDSQSPLRQTSEPERTEERQADSQKPEQPRGSAEQGRPDLRQGQDKGETRPRQPSINQQLNSTHKDIDRSESQTGRSTDFPTTHPVPAGNSPQVVAKKEKAKKDKYLVPSELTEDQMIEVKEFVSEKYPAMIDHVELLTDQCLRHHRSTDNKARYVRWVSVVETWIERQATQFGGMNGKTGTGNQGRDDGPLGRVFRDQVARSRGA